MADLREAIKQITGKEPSPEQINRIQAIAHALDIPQGDAMFPILATLDIYYGTFTRLPASMEASANKIAEKAERDTQGRIAAASAELVSKAGKQLVDAFRSDLGKTLWSRSIWAGLVLVVVGIGSYAAGEVDIWWNSEHLKGLENQETRTELKLKRVKEELSVLEDKPGYGVVFSCGGAPCVPLANIPQTWSVSSGPWKGTPLGVLDMQKIQQMEHPSQ
ncbi:MAG: hypothetical protein ACP5GA_10575 [Acidithiobacillus sp.]